MTAWGRTYLDDWDRMLILKEALWAWSRVQYVNRTHGTVPLATAALAQARAAPDEMAVADIRLEHHFHLFYSPPDLRSKPFLEATGMWTTLIQTIQLWTHWRPCLPETREGRHLVCTREK